MNLLINAKMALFLKIKKENKSIFLEPTEGDRVSKAVDVVASIFEKDPDDVRLVYNSKSLSSEKVQSRDFRLHFFLLYLDVHRFIS